MSRLNWDEYFMLQAFIVASRATCPRASVGAVVVQDNQIIASGYNGSVTGDHHCIDVGCKLDEEGAHCVRTVHAEMNALCQCCRIGSSSANATIYVTHFPCLLCSKLIIQSGIKHVKYSIPYKIDEYAVELLTNAGVEITYIRESIDSLIEKGNLLHAIRKNNSLKQQLENRS